MKRLLLFLISTSFLLIFNLPSVYACSGGAELQPPTVDTMLDGTLVRGRVIENSGGNSIVEVERYLNGSGSRYLFVYRQSLETYVTKAVRGYDFGCSYALSAVAEVGTRAYFSLGGGGSGIYSVSFYEGQNIFPIRSNEEGVFVHYGEATDDGYTQGKVATLDEFEAIIAERTGQLGTDPSSSRMPRFRILTIRTESGQSYQLPLDRNEIISTGVSTVANTECAENCLLVSPDGSHHLIPIPNDSDAYWVWYYGANWSEGFPVGDYTVYPPEIHAHAIMFSPNSDYFLAWYEDSMSLYFVNSNLDSGMYGNLPTLESVWSAQLAVTESMPADSFRELAAWSSNSNAFAYWDADGLKWMDVNMMQVPRLVLQYENIQSFAQTNRAGSIPPLLELSTTGRYIRYGDTNEWMLLDGLTGSEYDDMMVNPAETEFIAIDPEIPPYASIPNEEAGECAMVDLQGNCLRTNPQRSDFCLLPMATCSGSISLHDFQLQEMHWRDNNTFVYLVCESPESNLCYVNQMDVERPNYYSSAPERLQTNGFAYDEYYGYMAWATDDYHLRLEANPYREPLDFSAVLDSPIVSLEWGAPLWYLGE